MAERDDINCIFPPHESVRFTTGFTRFAGNFMEDQVCNPAICVEKVLHTQKAQTQISVFCADRAKSRSIQEAAQSHRYVHTGAPICLYIYRHVRFPNFHVYSSSLPFMVESVEIDLIISRTKSNVI